jgi:hypothetical protein
MKISQCCSAALILGKGRIIDVNVQIIVSPRKLGIEVLCIATRPI